MWIWFDDFVCVCVYMCAKKTLATESHSAFVSIHFLLSNESERFWCFSNKLKIPDSVEAAIVYLTKLRQKTQWKITIWVLIAVITSAEEKQPYTANPTNPTNTIRFDSLGAFFFHLNFRDCFYSTDMRLTHFWCINSKQYANFNDRQIISVHFRLIFLHTIS